MEQSGSQVKALTLHFEFCWQICTEFFYELKTDDYGHREYICIVVAIVTYHVLCWIMYNPFL